MFDRSSDDLDRRIAILLAADNPDGGELAQALSELRQRHRGLQGLLDRVIRIADGFQRAERERSAGYQESYEREVRRIEKIIRISDSYQSMLHASEVHYRDIYNHAPLAFVLFDREGRIVDWNRAAEAIFGWSREEMLGRDGLDLLVPESERQKIRDLLQQTLDERRPSRSVNANLTRGGAEVICEWINVLRYGSNGEIIGLLSLGMDISERFRLESDLRQAKDAAEQALADQRHFLSMASHEFRSPLAVIDSAAQVLEMNCRDHPDMHKVLQRIRRAVKRLSGFLDNCLTEDRLDTQNWLLLGRWFDLPAFLGSLVEQCRLLAPLHRLRLLDGGMPARFYGDPPLLQVMLHNLLENAVKYSPEGGEITLTAGPAEGGGLTISVADEGVGIPLDEQAQIFSKYVRGQVGGGIPGAGLGLYLVSRIAALHKGRVEVQSAPGLGARFTVVLPVNAEGAADDGGGER